MNWCILEQMDLVHANCAQNRHSSFFSYGGKMQMMFLVTGRSSFDLAYKVSLMTEVILAADCIEPESACHTPSASWGSSYVKRI